MKLPLLIACLAVTLALRAAEPTVLVGAAKIDITPELPIRLSGYQGRPAEATRVVTPLTARALAIGADANQPVIIIAAEIIGVSDAIRAQVVRALAASHRIAPERVAICTTHVHTGPALAGVIPYMFSRDLPPEESVRIARYTATFTQKLIEVAQAALQGRRPGRLAWGEGSANFAVQRRSVIDGKWKTFGAVPAGPSDHALPVLRASDARGGVRAVLASYACHCTTLEGADNYVHHDWAGDAARRIEAAHPGTIALVTIGCGADANPQPRGAAHVAAHGEKIAAEVDRLLASKLRPIGGVTGAKFLKVDLPLDRVVTRAELAERTANKQRVQTSYAATQYLRKLDSGEGLPAAVTLPVQAWNFGADLAMVFLGGEVVSEYSLRLKRELDGARLWVNAYANDVPSYIPSARMFPEGGYEVDGSMDYYGFPVRLAVGTEDKLIGSIRGLVPAEFNAQPAKK
ncbi:MAG: neutral/alkaline non-lysosomal ceramidase N-terminal domain-containing protein [Opitutaceae bacterium]|nr:neutral/alkaline non-lysosomal ceramidase N-terminal domain-containing protein [Opitutaceae bacterium]